MLDFFKNRIVNLLWNSKDYQITEQEGISYKTFIIRKNRHEELSRISVWFDLFGNSANVKGIILKNDFVGNRVYKNKLKDLAKTFNKLDLKVMG